MSSRALRKLQESKEGGDEMEEDEPSEEEFRDNKKQKGFNAFLLVSLESNFEIIYMNYSILVE